MSNNTWLINEYLTKRYFLTVGQPNWAPFSVRNENTYGLQVNERDG